MWEWAKMKTGPHWWEASAITTVPSPLPNVATFMEGVGVFLKVFGGGVQPEP